MNGPLSIIESGNGLSPEKYGALKMMLWETIILHWTNLPGQTLVQ
jgi:hypothetical protein